MSQPLASEGAGTSRSEPLKEGLAPNVKILARTLWLFWWVILARLTTISSWYKTLAPIIPSESDDSRACLAKIWLFQCTYSPCKMSSMFNEFRPFHVFSCSFLSDSSTFPFVLAVSLYIYDLWLPDTPFFQMDGQLMDIGEVLNLFVGLTLTPRKVHLLWSHQS